MKYLAVSCQLVFRALRAPSLHVHNNAFSWNFLHCLLLNLSESNLNQKYFRDTPQTLKVVEEAKQRREERRREKHKKYFIQTLFSNHTLLSKYSDPLRLIKEQQRQVSKVLLDGLYDPDSPISKLLGVRTEVMGEIVWQMLARNWEFYPDPANPDWL